MIDRVSFGNRDARNPCTIVERKISNARDAVSNRDACQIATTIERTVKDIPACYRYRFERGWNVVSSIVGGTSADSIIILFRCGSAGITAGTKNVTKRILVGIRRCYACFSSHKRNGDARKPCTIVERTSSNARDAIRDRDARKPCTTVERTISNARDAFRNRDARKPFTIAKRIPSNVRDAVRDRDACKPCTTVERTIENVPACYRYRFERGRNIISGISR